jgi:hypothetical protein
MKERFHPQPENPKQNAPEAGAGPLGLPPPSPEGQPLPSVLDVLERKVRLRAKDVEDRHRGEGYYHELREVNRSLDELYEKGTPRDRLIQHLYNARTMEPTGTLPDPATFRDLSLEQFKQFCTKAESLSEEEITEEIRKAKEEFKRKRKVKGRYFPPDSAGTF